MQFRTRSSYTAIAVKLGLLASLAGLGACSSVQTSASLTTAPTHRYSAVDPVQAQVQAPIQAGNRAPTISTALASDAMPYGQRTTAPLGFLEMCTRSPIDCAHSTDFQPERIRTLARADVVQAFRIAFSGDRDDGGNSLRSASISNDRRRQAPSAISDDSQASEVVNSDDANTVDVITTDEVALQPLPQLADWQVSLRQGGMPGAVGQSLPSSGYLSWAAKAPASIVRSNDQMVIRAPELPRALPALASEPQVQDASDNASRNDYERIDMDMSVLALLRTANDQVNGMMRPSTDEQTYGVEDYWNDPALRYGVRGDCEDFALEKRRLLIDRGVPAAALSIAIVRTRRDDEHAVLVVTTKAGDYVLDNLAADVRPWRRSGYTWISRQGPGDDLSWVSLAPANQSRATRTVYVANAF